MRGRTRTPGFSFCIITDGRRPDVLLDEIVSIRALNLETVEILVVGNVPPELGEDIIAIHAADLAFAGRLGAMRNRGCERARYSWLIVADDDMHFHHDVGVALRDASPALDVMCVSLLNPDGTRFWDWATIGGPRGHSLLDYDQTDDFVYITGGLAIMRAAVHDRAPWDEVRGFYQGEDVEWSARVREAGFRIGFDGRGCVTHQDPRYTQRERVMHFRQDLAISERIARDIEGTGFFRPVDPGFRWMSTAATLTVAPQPAPTHELHFSLSSAALTLLDAPLTVSVEVNGEAAGAFVFNGPQTFSAALPLSAELATRISLVSDRSAVASTVGIDDDRTVSVLLHEARIVSTL